ncbi:hypothetical protein GCM10010302_04640 [Streptomyces polychromogenes]|uniref:Secreted protein n=1 Tax=Streptomyces polychromogenes TaxID=67342 RepID=A0ABN0V150_9ACTN
MHVTLVFMACVSWLRSRAEASDRPDGVARWLATAKEQCADGGTAVRRKSLETLPAYGCTRGKWPA